MSRIPASWNAMTRRISCRMTIVFQQSSFRKLGPAALREGLDAREWSQLHATYALFLPTGSRYLGATQKK